MSSNPYDPTYVHVEAWHPAVGIERNLDMLQFIADKLGSLFPRFYYDESRRGPIAVPIGPESVRDVLSKWNPKPMEDLEMFFADDASQCQSTLDLSDLGGVRTTHLLNVGLRDDLCLSDPKNTTLLDDIAHGLAVIGQPISVNISTFSDRMNYRDGIRPKSTVFGPPDYVAPHWRNYWSPLLVQWAGGADAVLGQSWYATERLEGGWLRLDTAPSPFDWNLPEFLSRRDAVVAGLQLKVLNARILAAMDKHPQKTWPTFV